MYSDPTFFPDPRNIDSVCLHLQCSILWLFACLTLFLQLLELDKELSQFEGLSELKIAFPPSYPFKEDLASSGYMNTRCPSWCDRILMNKYAQKLVFDVGRWLTRRQSSRGTCTDIRSLRFVFLQNSSLKAKYEMMGYDVPMGDHKVNIAQ